MRRTFLAFIAVFTLAALAPGADGNRLTYLDELNPYYPHRTFPKLITPQWVGEDGVDAVVILAIDDMRGHEKWEQFLRPILNRLKKIDGRAPVSIMTCQIDPADPHLQKWLKEGVSLEVHTIDHPCPLLQKGDFAKAKSTYDRCVDLMNTAPGNKPVAFRMPCCDSLNTNSPRFYAEIFNKTTPKGHFLTLDSSVFQLFTPDDPELPRELVLDPDGRERFRKYIPPGKPFGNTIENYPYPYVIGRLCWEFPCMTPSDWQGQNLLKPANPILLRDWKAALDCTVIKKGVFSFVFHPYGWSTPEQLVDFIDYAQAKYGKRVKFLTFKEAEERLNKNVLAGQLLRDSSIGQDNGIRLLDLNNDGYLDVIVANREMKKTRVWQPEQRKWNDSEFPVNISEHVKEARRNFIYEARFGFLNSKDRPSMMWVNQFYHFDGAGWQRDEAFEKGLIDNEYGPIWSTSELGGDTGLRLRDLDGDGRSEVVIAIGSAPIFQWSPQKKAWQKLPFTFPKGAYATDGFNTDGGMRFVDIDEDGHDDVVFSTNGHFEIFPNENEYGIYIFADMQKGWSRKVIAGKQGAISALPLIARNLKFQGDGTNNGFWVHSRHLWWQNENTSHLPNLVDRRSFNDLLINVEPTAKSPEASLASIRTAPGFRAELMAHEPQVQDPIAFAFAPDGKLWVVEMGDYPLGTDGKGKFGGKIKFLESTKGDGRYDKATVFLENLGFPTGVLPWRNGILVTCAPEIFFVENDGGKAGKKEVLFSGFGQGNQQHRVNTLAWGLDNWIYVANGDSGGRITSKKTGKTVDISGRDLRIRPDTGEIEAVTGQTQFGRSRDDWDNWFGGNNADPLRHYVLPDHYLKRNPHFAPPSPRVQISVTPGTAPVFPVSRTPPRFNDPGGANRFSSACSPIVYRDTLYYEAMGLKEPAANAAGSPWILVSEPVHNLVHREVMRAEGVTFRSRRAAGEDQSEFVASTDNWFRPTTIATGPDGCLWIADMYRAVIEHPQWIPPDWQKRLDLRAGHDLGRIYRIVPVGVAPREIPRLDKLDTAGLVAALDSPSGWQRDTAQMMLLWKNDPAAVSPLRQLARASKNPLTRLHALCTLDGLNELNFTLLSNALVDPNPGIRRHGIRLNEGRFGRGFFPWSFTQLSEDADAQVRMQLAFTLGSVDSPKAGELLGKMAVAATDDPYMLAAVMSSVNRDNLDAVTKTVLSGGKAPPRLIGVLLSIVVGYGRSGSELLDLFAKPESGRFAAWQLAAVADLLDSLDQRGQSPDPAALARLVPLFTHARTLAGDAKASAADRSIALRLLGRVPANRATDQELLAGFLTPQTAPELQSAAVAAIGRVNDDAARAKLIAAWKQFGPGLRGQAAEALLRRDAGVRAVLAALEQKQIESSELDAAARQRLLSNKSADIRTRAEKLLAGSADPDRKKVIDAFRPALTLKGDVEKGKAVYAKICAACHKFGGVGNEVGPDLAALGGRSPEYLLVNILDPNLAVEARYVNYIVETKGGVTYTGVLTGETGTSVTVVGTDGVPKTVLRTDLESLTSTGKSAMPEGLEKDLKPQDFADLLAHLRAGTKIAKRKEFAGNRPELVKPSNDGALRLTAKNAEIFGTTLVFEDKYSNLGYWSSGDDFAAWTVQVPAAGKYEVWLDFACPAENSGNTFALEWDGGRFSGAVPSTGNWDTYKQEKLGEIALAAGEQRFTMRADGPIRGGALIDLRGVRLVKK